VTPLDPGLLSLIGPPPEGPEFCPQLEPLWARSEWLRQLDECPQDSVYHAEGDVGVHTRAVVASLCEDPEWRALSEPQRHELYAAALVHDLGKPRVTRPLEEEGRYSARGHARVGARVVRQLLWRAGVAFPLRERICALVDHHLVPFHAHELEDSERTLRRIGLGVELSQLAILARADARGRSSTLQGELLAGLELFRELSTELSSRGLAPYPDGWTRFRYFRDPSRSPEAQAFDDSRLEVVVLAGIPGVGKTTWAARELGDRPRVSLDDLRVELKISPTENQGPVAAAARAHAREHLRAERSFVWDATNLSRDLRRQVVDLCDAYHARVRLVYLEVPSEVAARQNRERAGRVPQAAIERMLRRWDLPDLAEAAEVEYRVR
jgi:predicted kinase